MISNLILLFLGFTQLDFPLSNQIHLECIDRLSVALEMRSEKESKVSYKVFLMKFYDAITLPSIKEVFLYDRGDNFDSMKPTSWWNVEGANCRGWIAWLEIKKTEAKLFGNYDQVALINEKIRMVEVVHSVYDKIDDSLRTGLPLLTRRRAIKYVKDKIGEENFDKMDLPRPEIYIFPNWGGVK